MKPWKPTLITLIALALAGCKTEVWRTVPTTDSEREAVRKMVVEVCAAANSPANKDPEDLVKQAEETAMRVVCKPTRWWYDSSAGWIPVSEPEVKK